MEETIKKIRRLKEITDKILKCAEVNEYLELSGELYPDVLSDRVVALLNRITELENRITELENQVNYFENGDETYNLKAAARKLADYIEQNDL